MDIITILLIFVPCSLLIAILLGSRKDRKRLLWLVTVAWALVLPAAGVVNYWSEFTGGGDDEDYYRFGLSVAKSGEWVFDPATYEGNFEQPGYPMLVAIVMKAGGSSLLAAKTLNCFSLIVVALLWYSICAHLDASLRPFRMAVIILMLPSLWYYSFFLLKDIVIVLIQSLLILGTVMVFRGRYHVGWPLIVLSSILVLPLRSQLVIVNLSVVVVVTCVKLLMRMSWPRVIATMILLSVSVGGTYAVASNPELMAQIGITAEHRIVGSDASRELARASIATSSYNMAQFPLLYLVTETNAFNMQSWGELDAINLRGLLALPWILIGVPCFLIGSWKLIRDIRIESTGEELIGILRVPLLANGWISLIVFILAYVAISWTVGDTTRWRLPDMPAMALIALYGWTRVDSWRARSYMLLLWGSGCSIAFILYVLLR